METAPKPGRTKMPQETVDLIISIMTKNSTTRAWSYARISQEAAKSSIMVSPSLVYRILKDNNYSSCKQTVKPGLTLAIKKACYNWCKAHKHWELEDWKNVIWTDETSV